MYDFVNQGSFSVVNMGNNSNISDSAHCGGVNWGAFCARLRTRESTTFFVVNRGFNVLREFNFSQGVWNGIFAE